MLKHHKWKPNKPKTLWET